MIQPLRAKLKYYILVDRLSPLLQVHAPSHQPHAAFFQRKIRVGKRFYSAFLKSGHAMLDPADKNKVVLPELWRHIPFAIHLAVYRNYISQDEAVLYCELEDMAVFGTGKRTVPF